MNTSERNGMTLIELLAVILIIMILVGLMVPVLQAARDSARKKRAKAEAVDLTKAWEGYWRTYTNWPAAGGLMDGTRVGYLNGNNLSNVKFMDFPRNALTTGFKDPWGTPYKVVLSEDDISYTWKYATRVYFRNKSRYEYD